jgi:hypothetical protein
MKSLIKIRKEIDRFLNSKESTQIDLIEIQNELDKHCRYTQRVIIFLILAPIVSTIIAFALLFTLSN